MSDQPDQADRDALRQVQRRNMVRGLGFLPPTVVLWWLVDHWLRRRGTDPDLALFVTLLLTLAVIWPLTWLGLLRQGARQSVPPRLRSLMEARRERLNRRLRWVFIASLTLMLVSNGLQLVRGFQGSGIPAPCIGGWEILFLAMILLGDGWLGPIWPWPTARVPDESRVSTAIRHGYAILILLGLAAAVPDVYRPDLLHVTLPMVLIAGLLAPLLSLALGRPAEPTVPTGQSG